MLAKISSEVQEFCACKGSKCSKLKGFCACKGLRCCKFYACKGSKILYFRRSCGARAQNAVISRGLAPARAQHTRFSACKGPSCSYFPRGYARRNSKYFNYFQDFAHARVQFGMLLTANGPPPHPKNPNPQTFPQLQLLDRVFAMPRNGFPRFCACKAPNAAISWDLCMQERDVLHFPGLCARKGSKCCSKKCFTLHGFCARKGASTCSPNAVNS